MPLVLLNRVQETATANTTVSFTLTGAVTGFQTFAAIGNTNTTYYAATDNGGGWEVGLGTYSTTGPTLTRTTVYASSNAGSAVTFAGTVNVFLTYPADRSVNLDASGNASALGTPVSATLTNATGLPVATGISGLGSGVATFLATPSSANLAAAVSDETGTGALVFANSPTLVTPALGTPSALVGTNITGTAAGLTAGNVTTNANLTGAITSTGNATLLGSFSSANLAGALTDETGTGSAVFANSPTLVTPALGTPASGVVTNLTGTASININGTVGATTATTGAFTTLTTSSDVTLSGGTANGVAYLNGSKVLTTGSALTFDGTSLRNGIIGSPDWNIAYKQVAVGAATVASTVAVSHNSLNMTNDGTNWKYQATGTAYKGSAITQFDGALTFYATASAGNAGNTAIVRTLFNVSNAGDGSFLGTVTLNSGTANGVAFLNSSKVLTTGSALTFDGTNLGNTRSVATAFSGTNSATWTNGIVLTNTATPAAGVASLIAFQGTGNVNSVFGVAQNSSGYGDFVWASFAGSFSEQMRLTSTGLGIGTSSPTRKLDVVDNGNINATSAISNSTAGTSSLARFLAVSDAGSAVFGMTSSSYTDISGAQDAMLLNANSASGGIAFALDGTLSMKLDSSGNLGLGVTPSAWDSAFKAFQLNTTACISATSNRTFLGQNWYDAASGGKFIGTGYALRYDQLGSNGEHQWYTSTASGTAGNAISFTQAMTLDASGVLLVGKTSNSTYAAGGALFAVNGAADNGVSIAQSNATGPFLTFFNSANSGFAGFSQTAAGTLTVSASSAFTFSVNSAERARIDSSGNFIVGSTGAVDSSKFQIFGAKTISSGIPQQQLNVADTTAIAAGVGGAISFSALYSGASFTTMGSVEGVRENGTEGNYAGALVFKTRANGGDNNERARITSGGDFGIGTSSPAYKLDIAVAGTASYSSSSAPTPNIYLGTTGAANSRYTSIGINCRGTSGQSQTNYITSVPEATDGNAALAFSVYGGYAAVERARITSGGELLVGLTSATGVALLQVSGPIRTTGYTVATLPAGTVGMRTYVTDALAPAFGVAVAGSGAVTIPVFYDGANWIVA
jgi:hypothetical protein